MPYKSFSQTSRNSCSPSVSMWSQYRRRSPLFATTRRSRSALYEIELYLACRSLPDLDAGIYHHSPSEFGLRRLRAGDFRRVLVNAAAEEFSIAHAPVIIICTGTYWRNAWKYQARTYRHFGWDNGTILGNLLAVSAALELPAKVICGFVDADVNRLLDLDAKREVAFSLVSIGRVADLPPVPPHDISPLRLGTVPLSAREVDYPVMQAMHAASSLLSPEEVAHWRGNAVPVKPKMAGELTHLTPWATQKFRMIQLSK